MTGTTRLPMKSFLLSVSSSNTANDSICTSGCVTLSGVGSCGVDHMGLKPLSGMVSVRKVWGSDEPSLVSVTCGGGGRG